MTVEGGAHWARPQLCRPLLPPSAAKQATKPSAREDPRSPGPGAPAGSGHGTGSAASTGLQGPAASAAPRDVSETPGSGPRSHLPTQPLDARPQPSWPFQAGRAGAAELPCDGATSWPAGLTAPRDTDTSSLDSPGEPALAGPSRRRRKAQAVHFRLAGLAQPLSAVINNGKRVVNVC